MMDHIYTLTIMVVEYVSH